MKELTDEQIYKIWYQTRGIGTVAFCGNFARAAIAADRALNAEDHDPLEPKRLESIADPTLRAVCETYTNTLGGHFMRLQAIAKLVPAPADRAPRTYDQEHAIKEGHRNKAEDDYFNARPQVDHNMNRVYFKGGFDRGWDAAKKDAPADRDVMRQMLRSVERTHAGYMVGHDKSDAPAGSYSDGFTRGFGECVRLLRELAAERTPPAEQQREQEPVAFLTRDEDGTPAMLFLDAGEATAYCGENEVPEPLYTHPPSPPAEQQGEPEPVAWLTATGDVTRSRALAEEHSAMDSGRQTPTPLYTQPSLSLAELRAKVEALQKYRWAANETWLVGLDDVLAEIDKMGGKL